MHTAKWNDIEGKAVTDAGAKGVTIRVLMGDNVGAPTFTMRHFEIAPGGRTPFHAHAWEHEVYILSGRGKVRQKDGDREGARSPSSSCPETRSTTSPTPAMRPSPSCA